MNRFKKTDKQLEAVALLSSPAKRIMLYGGSRSGKTAILIYSILVRAFKKKVGMLYSGLGSIMLKPPSGMIPYLK